jgi:hypothetical protein
VQYRRSASSTSCVLNDIYCIYTWLPHPDSVRSRSRGTSRLSTMDRLGIDKLDDDMICINPPSSFCGCPSAQYPLHGCHQFDGRTTLQQHVSESVLASTNTVRAATHVLCAPQSLNTGAGARRCAVLHNAALMVRNGPRL